MRRVSVLSLPHAQCSEDTERYRNADSPREELRELCVALPPDRESSLMSQHESKKFTRREMLKLSLMAGGGDADRRGRRP